MYMYYIREEMFWKSNAYTVSVYESEQNTMRGFHARNYSFSPSVDYWLIPNTRSGRNPVSMAFQAPNAWQYGYL